MAAYCWVDDLVTCRLTACAPRSALGPTLGNQYGKPLLFHHYLNNIRSYVHLIFAIVVQQTYTKSNCVNH